MLHSPQFRHDWDLDEVRSRSDWVVHRLVPALDLGEASVAENLQVALIQIPAHVEVGVLRSGTSIRIHLGSLSVSCSLTVRGSLSVRLGRHSLLGLLYRCEHQRVLFAAPDSETGRRTWL